MHEENYLMHEGTKRHSGRYPYGSGDNPYQHEAWFRGFEYDEDYSDNPWFCDAVAKLRDQGLTQSEIAIKLTPKNNYKYYVASKDDPERGIKKGDRVIKLDEDGNPIREFMTVDQLRARNAVSLKAKKQEQISQAIKLKDKGMSNMAIAERMFGDPKKESTVRNLLADNATEKALSIDNTTKMLRDTVKDKEFIDVGRSAELLAGNITRSKLNTAVAALIDEGYEKYNIQAPQLGTNGNKTTIMVLCPPGTSYSEARKAVLEDNKLQTLGDYHTNDGGVTWLGIRTPQPIDISRVAIKSAEEGGKNKDGLIEIRPGVEDLSLGKSSYAQVRIQVGNERYIKGVAIYNNNLPEGIDILVNSKKSSSLPKEQHLKLLKGLKEDANGKVTGTVDKNNPFGASIKTSEEEEEVGAKLLAGGQSEYIGKDGKKHLSCINKVNEEGDWDNWSKTLASQFLSKQSPKLAKQQLDMAYEAKINELEKIESLTNPAVKRRLLEPFAEKCDSDAVKLRGAALPRQKTCVIIPSTTLKDNEVYAPNFKDGETVVLVRYPHAGKFEMPELVVNNRNRECREAIGTQPKDAIMINAHVASQMSGADFDGDNVLVIPNNNKSIKSQKPLDGLKDFDTEIYARPKGTTPPKHSYCQNEMGRISNLITDMTVIGAPMDEMARAVKHSMVVIDAEKHNLDIKKSQADFRINELKQKYQSAGGGAGTLISRASSQEHVLDRRKARVSEGGPINPETGEINWIETGKTTLKPKTKTVNGEKVILTDENGRWIMEEKPKTIKSTKMAEAKDPYTLLSGPNHEGTAIERVYAEHASKLKALANKARKDSLSVGDVEYNEAAASKYSKEVSDLKDSLRQALLNQPAERKAQAQANSVLKQYLKDNPDLKNDKDKYKKLRNQAIAGARSAVGAKKPIIEITPKQWEAIQAGAIRKSMLKDILDNTDLETVTNYALPRQERTIPQAKISRIQSLLSVGYTQAQVAEQLGVSVATVNKYA